VFFRVACDDVRPFLDSIGAEGWGVRRDVPGEDARDHGPAIEVYFAGRFFTVTGTHFPSPHQLAMIDRAALDRLAPLVPRPKAENGAGGQGDDATGDNSRSAAALAAAREWWRHNPDGSFDEMVEALRADPETTDWVRQKGLRYNKRELHRIWDKVTRSLDAINEMNQKHAVIRTGNKVVVMMETVNDFGFSDFALLGTDAFKLWHGNKRVTVGVGDKQKQLPLAEIWLRDPNRRQYNGITFSPGRETPGRYNLWSGGFAVDPGPGDCSLLLDHIKTNVATGDAHAFHWIIGWFAEIVQKPAQKSGTSLVLRGETGTGKTVVFEAFGRLLGPHYALVDDDRYVTGRFNSHMARLLLLFADEAFWAGDRTAEGRIRSLITGSRHFIEMKGVEPIAVPNHMRLGVAGNKTWMVPALMRDRRFCIYTMGERNIQNTAYFAAIQRQLDDGGYAGLLRYLLEFDLSTVDMRSIPRTDALLDSVVSSMDDLTGWWFSVLWGGELPGGCAGLRQCSKRSLYRSYLKHTQDRNYRGQRSIEVQVGRFLHGVMDKVVPGLRESKDACTYADDVQRIERAYTLPHLGRCRAAFVRNLGQAIRWPGCDPDLMDELPDDEAEPELDGVVDPAQDEDWGKASRLDVWDDGKV
jgi:hypothetical protein